MDDRLRGTSNICNVPTSSPTASNWCRLVVVEGRNSIEAIFEWVALSSMEGLKLESVKSQTRICPSAPAINNTAGRVLLQAPAVKYVEDSGETNSG